LAGAREVAVAKLVMTEDESVLHDAIGTVAFLRARELVKAAVVAEVRWEPGAGRAHGEVRGPHRGMAAAALIADPRGLVALDGTCTCADHPSCAHPAAVALAAISSSGLPDGSVDPGPAWSAALSTLLGDKPLPPDPGQADQVQIGLQFEVNPPEQPRPGRRTLHAALRSVWSGATPADRHRTAPSWRVGMRPVLPGQTGWVRSGISWSGLDYLRLGGAVADQHRRILKEILLLSTAGDRQYGYGYRTAPAVIPLDTFGSRRIWDLLAEAEELGLPLVQAGRPVRPVVVCRTPVQMIIRAERVDGDLVLAPELGVDGMLITPGSAILIGHPAHGVVFWQPPRPSESASTGRVLRLAAVGAATAPQVEHALAAPAIRIPTRDEPEFFRRHYRDLLRRVQVVAPSSAGLPDVGPARLVLTVDQLPGHSLSLAWHWAVPLGDEQHGEPLRTPVTGPLADHRERILARVSGLIADLTPDLLEPGPSGPMLAETAALDGDAMVRFLADLAPQLRELDHVDLITGSDEHGLAYHELDDPPVIAFASTDGDDPVDWFDLSVRVSVGGEQVPFDELFIALAEGRSFLVLASGAYFSLDRAELRQLRDLIIEARELEDAPPGTLRVGRFQAGLWQELADLGEVIGQARAWQQTVSTLTEAGVGRRRAVPRSLRAKLRPYQREGFRWLATLYDIGLGGVLADDMGLGKTIQALGLICHARETGRLTAPFLVVAPASVVHNWVTEAGRFTRGLTVAAITQTRARRGCELAEAVAGADLVVTSYTLFRLEYDDYHVLDWAGLVLDEAQFVKNASAVGHRCARRLPAGFKLAMTGTPMENNLGELWSICAITSPGLLPRPDRFSEYYRTPIEKARDAGRLDQLRRRIRPLMLRRRKADVAADLPEKLDQVIELELEPRHRKAYQTYLQRERQKVLGLLGDFERNRFQIFRSLTLLRQASLDVSLVDPRRHAVPSTKLDALTEQVLSLAEGGHRSLVFSQFTRFLGAARARLEAAGIECCYLDGATRNRPAVLAEFKTGTRPVFLISLKAGGFGLNLTEADYCILLDPWWNPATEEQAVDRAHRIGQTQKVMVYRLVAKDTIEEKVMALKARKAELFSSVLDGGDFASARLTAADIRALLT
jgi:superfamily II DNA or RNA helicase